MSKIRVGIIGVGSCAKSLVEGVQYYNENPEDKVGLMYDDIGGYTVHDIEFVCGFDIDKRKVNKKLATALRAQPNCAMNHVDEIHTNGESNFSCVSDEAIVYSAPEMDGIAPHMHDYPDEVTFVNGAVPAESFERTVELIQYHSVDVLINYLPVGSDEATKYWIDVALDAGVHFVNCIPTMISTDDAMVTEQRFIDAGLTIVGSDMRSAWGASRMSEVLQGAMLDSGLMVTQHIQMNMAAGSTQGQENIRTGRTANTDFLNMAKQDRLHNKHISKENVLKGQNIVRDESTAGMTLFAGPSLTVQQKPGGDYVSSDNKIANFDMIAYGFAGARYEVTARLSVQDSPNSGGVVVSAIRFCKVAAELGVVGYLRGPSAWTQKTPPVQLKTEDAKFECDALARRELTSMTEVQLKKHRPVAKQLAYTFQESKTDYEN
jgi:myo-inositol-1-phosphate synthase|tara:strand:- start:163 stop:1461 length:1299 start_codon:yes stop_codon:yes gene_type:complete